MKECNSFINLHHAPFGRKGSFFILQQGDMGQDHFGRSDLWLGTTRSAGFGYSSVDVTNRVINITLSRNGRSVPFAISNTPGETILETDFGSMHICISEYQLIQFHSTDGLGLVLSAPLPGFHSIVKDMLDGTWQFITRTSAVNWLLVPVTGTCDMCAPYDWRAMKTTHLHATYLPDKNGILDVSIEEFEHESVKRPSYPDYYDSVAQVQKEFEDYRDASIPDFSGEFKDSRDITAWMIWSHTRVPAPTSKIKHEMVIMMQQEFGHCFGWQQAFQAIANCKNVELAWNLLQSVFDYEIPETGQLPDHIDELVVIYQDHKPPLYGFALNWLIDHCDLTVISKERKELLYSEMTKHYDFFFKYRDLDHDGLPEYHHCDESGCDDSSIFSKGLPVTNPELAAYLITMADALSRLAAILGWNAEAKKWDKEADALTKRVVEKLWNGERFTAFRAGTNAAVEARPIGFFTPLLIGKRLPKEIVDTVVADLFKENIHICPYGVPSEAMDSPYFEHRWSRGTVQAPTTALVVFGLAACGRMDEARDVAYRYANTLLKNGFYHMHDPLTGLGDDKAIGANSVQHWSSWSAAIYVTLVSSFCL